jgi:hypothetical protein
MLMDGQQIVGRVLRATTIGFTVGCRQLITEQDHLIPQFGALVRADAHTGAHIYGLIANVTIEDDAFVRQLVAAGVERPEIIEDQRQRRQVPVVVEVLIAGSGRGAEVYHRLPAQPPSTLDQIYLCQEAEIRHFTERHDWLRLILGALNAPVDQLLIAAIRLAAEARPEGQRELYRIGIGRELAKLLALDLARLDNILRGVKETW